MSWVPWVVPWVTSYLPGTVRVLSPEGHGNYGNLIVKCLSGANLKLPVFYDIEDTGTEGKGRADGLSRAQRTANALAFAEVIAEEGYTPGVYANRWYLTSELDADALRNAGVSIWLAEYTNNERPAYREAYDYWQYSKTGRVPGIDGDADLDRVYA